MNFIRLYILPGLIFQSVLIGGGYATGRELIEFFLTASPLQGLLGLIVSGLVFSLVLAFGFEFARICKAYDYRQFSRALLGRGWILFEIAFLLLLILILSVIGSASGELLYQLFGLPPLAGILILMALIGILTFKGSETIKIVLAGWSGLLYAVYIILFLLVFNSYSDDIVINLTSSTAITENGNSWLTSGILYAGYNIAVLPTILFAVSNHSKRHQTIGAGLIAGALAIIPAILFFIAMMALYPDIKSQPVPATYLMAALDISWLNILFQIVVFGTFIETGAALLHACNERIDHSFAESGRDLPQIARPLIAVAFLTISIFAAAQIGIIDLIASGYSTLTLVFIVVLILPLLTYGGWRIWHEEK